METLLSIIKGAPLWLQHVFEVMVVLFVAMMFISIIAGIWFAGLMLRKRVNYIAEVSAFPPKITFHPKEVKHADQQ